MRWGRGGLESRGGAPGRTQGRGSAGSRGGGRREEGAARRGAGRLLRVGRLLRAGSSNRRREKAAAPRGAGVEVAIAEHPWGRGRGSSAALGRLPPTHPRPARWARPPRGPQVGGSGDARCVRAAGPWASAAPRPLSFPGAATREAPRRGSPSSRFGSRRRRPVLFPLAASWGPGAGLPPPARPGEGPRTDKRPG